MFTTALYLIYGTYVTLLSHLHICIAASGSHEDDSNSSSQSLSKVINKDTLCIKYKRMTERLIYMKTDRPSLPVPPALLTPYFG